MHFRERSTLARGSHGPDDGEQDEGPYLEQDEIVTVGLWGAETSADENASIS